MVAAVQFKWCMTGARIFSVVIYKLSYWQELCPIILLEVDKSSKIGLHGAVLSFCLTIYLRIESSGEPLLDAKKVAKQ